jgi:hypothetical protein
MQGWKDMPLAKGTSRQPRPHPNYSQRQNQDQARTLLILQGGDPSQLTHQPTPRRGSRRKSGGSGHKTIRADSLARQADADLQDYQADPYQAVDAEPKSAEVIDLAQFREQVSRGEMQPIAAPTDECSKLERNESSAATAKESLHMWSDADFTPEALAKHDRELAHNRETQAQVGAKFRREMEQALLRFRGKPKQAPPRSSQQDNGRCVSKLPLASPEVAEPQKPLPRGVLTASHQYRSPRSKKK